MTILNNVVSKLSNSGTSSKRTKVEEEIKNFEYLTVSSYDDANELQDFKKILMNDANSDLHKWSAGSKDFNSKLNSDNK